MKLGTRILLFIIAVIVTLFIIASGVISTYLSRWATREVNKALLSIPDWDASCGQVQVGLIAGSTTLKDVRLSYRSTCDSTNVRPGSDIRIERIELTHNLFSFMRFHEIRLNTLRVFRPKIELWLDEEHPERSFPTFTIDTTVFNPNDLPAVKVLLNSLHVKNASLALHSVRTKLDVAADSCSLSMQHFCYDSVFSCCDSLYSLSVGQAKVLFPDSLMMLSVCDLTHRNASEILLGATHIRNTMPKKQLADIMEEPVTWIDMQMDSIRISPLNLFRMAQSSDFAIDHIQAHVAFMDIFRDERYNPRRIYTMPQPVLMALPVTFDVMRTDAVIDNIHIAFAATDNNIGHLDMQQIDAGVDHITNRRGETIHLSGHCPFGTGWAEAAFDLAMNDSSTFGMHIHATEINTSVMDHFIRPLVGMTSDCVIDTLDTHYTGTNYAARGTYRMLYHDFSIRVHKEDDIPFPIITKHAKTFNTLGNTLIPKTNQKYSKPTGYYVAWTRDERKPTELYLFGPIIDGIKKTFLPGLYVHMQINQKNRK